MIGKKDLIQPSPVFYIYPFFFLSEDLIYKRNYRNEFGQINYSFVNTLSSLFWKDPLWPLRQMVLRRNFSLEYLVSTQR